MIRKNNKLIFVLFADFVYFSRQNISFLTVAFKIERQNKKIIGEHIRVKNVNENKERKEI